MYLKLKSDEIHWRISRVEAEQLISGISLNQSIQLSPQTTMKYRVEPTENHREYQFDDICQTLTAFIDKGTLQDELANRPSKQGIQLAKQSTAQSTVFLQIDIKKR